jgi:hypothetical protein
MKKLEKILFVYSIVAITFVFITSGIFTPSPQSLISSMLLFPILAFFWIRVTNPQEVNVAKWSLRLVIVVILISALGIYGSFLSQLITGKDQGGGTEITNEEASKKIEELEAEIEQLRQQELTSKELAEKLAEIKDELTRLNTEGKLALGTSSEDSDLAKLLADLEENEQKSSVGYVTMRDQKISEIDVLYEPQFSSYRVGTIKFGETYPYSEVDRNWYKIKLPDETFGWVHDRDVRVIN